MSFPLHDLSVSAAMKVKEPLDVPTTCNICSGIVALVPNSEIYGKSYGSWPWAYRCVKCHAYVGIHNKTLIPLGTLADAPTRNARKKVKPLFNKLWESGKMTRVEAYTCLAIYLGIPLSQCHFGMFTVQQCNDAKHWIDSQNQSLLEF
jgi:hypothetical protein